MTQKEKLQKQIEEFIMSGKDPFVIARELTEFILSSKKKSNADLLADTDKWIDDWILLFPAGVKSGSRMVRSDRNDCLNKMVTFRSKHPQFTVEDIFHATDNYVKELAQKDYAFMKRAGYFIHKKDEGSELASRCENLAFVEKQVDKEAERVENFFG